MLSILNEEIDIGLKTLETPIPMIEKFNECLLKAQSRIFQMNAGLSQINRLRAHQNIHCRFKSLPQCSGTFHKKIPGVEALGRLISVKGTVTRLGPVRLMERSKTWSCGKCGTQTITHPDNSLFGSIPKPVSCIALVDDRRCGGVKFDEVREGEASTSAALRAATREDYQEIRIQEMTSQLGVGALPRSLTIVLRHDLVDVCKAGDEVIIVGWMLCRWRQGLKSEMLCEADFALVANHVTTVNKRASLRGPGHLSITEWSENYWNRFPGERKLIGRNKIVSAFCPQIYGLFLVKLAVLMTVIGGCGDEGDSHENMADVGGAGTMRMVSSQGNNRMAKKVGARNHRKEGHLLLVGDPGTAKSQFLVSAAKLIIRSVMTTGSGSTSAGLTVAAVKEGGEWQLEAGALILADRGICCIDEFNGLRGHDRTAIHEAMEQQTLSVAKAGLVCKLHTRCSIIAACNSKGKFEEGESISTNVALASPLISRFDLILVMTDRHNEEWDNRLSTTILEGISKPKCSSRPAVGEAVEEITINFSILRSYINHVRLDGHPLMTLGARIVLGKYYQLQRKADLRDAARTTIRLLESLVRLAQAHAKLMQNDSVELSDAIWSVILMETSMSTQSLLDVRPDLYAALPQDYPDDVLHQYQQYEYAILRRLEINPKLLEPSDLDNISPLPLDEDAERILATWASTQK